MLFDFALFSSQWLADEIFCTVDFEDGEGAYGNGCETEVAADVNNCGGCGFVCQGQNANPNCVAGLCEFDCLVGFDDCDEDPNTGCETALTTLSDCGTCGSPCTLATPTQTRPVRPEAARWTPATPPSKTAMAWRRTAVRLISRRQSVTTGVAITPAFCRTPLKNAYSAPATSRRPTGAKRYRKRPEQLR